MITFSFVFFWLCPIFFTIAEIILIKFNDSFDFENKKSPWTIIIPIIDGLILLGFQKLLISLLNFININFSTYKELMYAIIYLNAFFLFCYLYYVFQDEIDFPILGTFIYGIIAIIICFLFSPLISDLKFSKELKNMNYIYDRTETIELTSMNGELGTSGIIENKICYLNGVLNGNYKIYYVEKEEDGNLVIDSIDYNKEHVKIYENNKETPRIDIKFYKKELINPENEKIIKTDEYKDYIFYIPEGTYNNTYNSGF